MHNSRDPTAIFKNLKVKKAASVILAILASIFALGLLGALFSFSGDSGGGSSTGAIPSFNDSNVFYYVSLGDSITAGQAMENEPHLEYPACLNWQYGVNGNRTTRIQPKTYTDLIRQDLYNTYGRTNVSAVSYANSGETVDELIVKLDDPSVRKAVAKADLVTVCIGANAALGPAVNNIENYLISGNSVLDEMCGEIENNIADLSTSYTILFRKLNEINPDAKYVFTTIYNPYKYLHIEEGREGFFGSLLNTIPEIKIDIDEYIEDTFMGGTELSYPDISSGGWTAIELDLNISTFIKDSFLGLPVVERVTSRVNTLGGLAEKYIEGEGNYLGMNRILNNRLSETRRTNKNFYLVDTKALFDTYPDRPTTADVYYNDLVNVEFTRGYDISDVDWGLLWEGSDRNTFWKNLIWKYLSFKNAAPSLEVWDYVSFDMDGFSNELITLIVKKVIKPDTDAHPEPYGHKVLSESFMSVIKIGE